MELLQLARAGGIQVRHVALGGSGGGMARVKDKSCLFVDVQADPQDQLEQTVNALAALPQLKGLPTPPDVAALLENARRSQ